MVSKSVLNIQITQFIDKLTFIPEIIEEMNSVFKVNAKCIIKEFKKISSTRYEVIIERDKAYELNAKIHIPNNYPEVPPTFILTMVKF